MKKSILGKRIMCMALITGLLISGLAGCSKKGEPSDSNSKGEATTTPSKEAEATKDAAKDPMADNNGDGFTDGITLDGSGSVNIFAFSEGQNYEKVISKFEELTKDTLKTDLNFQWASDIKTEQPLQLAAQGDIDLIFDAGWLNMASNISQGMYQDISKYFNNPEYPGLQKAFSPDVVESMKNPADGMIYGIPFYTSYNNIPAILIRGDWREKLGCDPVVDDATLQKYLEAVDAHKDELGAVSAMGLGDREFYYFQNKAYDLQDKHIFEVPSTGARITQYAYVLLNDANNQVLDVAYVGDPDSEFADWPITNNFLNASTLNLANTWSKFVNGDAITLSGADKTSKFQTGLYGAVENELSGLPTIEKELKKTDPNAKLEYYIYDDQIRNKSSVYMYPAISNNYLCVPYFNENPDRAMAVLDWVFENQKNNDLFNYGIEGEDYEAVGDSQYKVLTNDAQYTFPTWLWSNNPTYMRYDAELPADILDYIKWSADANNFKKNPFAGFNFDITNIATEYTAFTTIQQDYYKQFMSGLFGSETQAKLDEFYGKTKDYSAALKEEVKKQMNDYFANKK